MKGLENGETASARDAEQSCLVLDGVGVAVEVGPAVVTRDAVCALTRGQLDLQGDDLSGRPSCERRGSDEVPPGSTASTLRLASSIDRPNA